MGRMVYIETGAQSVTAASDLVELKAGAAQMFIVHSIIVTQSSEEDTTAELLPINVKRGAGSFTSGSGGGSCTVVKGNPADSAHGLAAVERNNTTQAVAGSGTLETIPIHSGVMDVLAGEWERTPTPEMRLTFNAGEALIISVPAPDDAVSLNCAVALELVG